jgi:hypothetical protein
LLSTASGADRTNRARTSLEEIALSAVQRPVNEITDAELMVHWIGRGELSHEVLRGLSERGVHVLRSATADCPPARIAYAEPAPASEQTTDLRGRRILVLHSNPEQASLLTWALSARGADARFHPDLTTLLADAGSSDADAVLVDEQDLLSGSWDHVCALWRHLRLRWTPCVVAPPNLLQQGDAAELEGLCIALQALAVDHDRCAAEARDPSGAELPLSALGPARTLRTLLESKRALAVEFGTARLTVEVDVADGLILGARARFSDGASVEMLGVRALAALLEEIAGTVRIHAARQAPLANLMASLDDALRSGGVSRTTSTEDSVLLLLTNPSASGIRPAVGRDGTAQEAFTEEELEDPTRKLSENSVIALMKEQEALGSAEPEVAPEQPAPPRPVPPVTRRKDPFARVAGGLARAVLTLAALGLVALCAATLWEEYRPLQGPAAARVHKSELHHAPAAPPPEVSQAHAVPAPLLVATAPAEPPRDPAVTRLVRRANDMRRRHQRSRARSLYERALELAPDEPSALAGLARTALDQGDLATALNTARKLVALDPEESNYRVLLERAEKLEPRSASHRRER